MLRLPEPVGDVDALPDEADTAIEQVEKVALAVALLAAAVRGGQDWVQISSDLLRDADVFGDLAMRTPSRRCRLPSPGCPKIWPVRCSGSPSSRATHGPRLRRSLGIGHTRAAQHRRRPSQTWRLASANLLSIDRDVIEFHDLQHDYLHLHAPALARLHGHVLDAYRVLLPSNDDWSQLPPQEPYIWDRLVTHLRRAGARRELASTVTDSGFLVQRIAAGGVLLAEADLADAAAALPTDPGIAWWRTWLPRHNNVLVPDEATTDIGPRISRLTPTFRAWLDAEPGRPIDVDPHRLDSICHDPYLAVLWGLAPPSPAQTRVLTGHTASIRAAAWSPDGSRLATASNDLEIRLWDPETGDHIATLSVNSEAVHAIAWSHDGSYLAGGYGNGAVQVWAVHGWSPAAALHTNQDSIYAVDWSPDGRQLAVAGSQGQAVLWNPASGHTEPVSAHAGPVTALAWSPDGGRLATAGADRVIRLCDPETGRGMMTLTGHGDWIYALSWSPDGVQLASASGDRTVRLWDGLCGQATATLTGHTAVVRRVSWSPDGSRLASASGDGTARLWDPGERRSSDTLVGHTAAVNAVVWSPDGCRVATVGNDREVRLWNAESGRPAAAVDNQTSSVRAMAWLSGLARLAAVTDAGTVRLYELATGHSTTIAHPAQPLAVACAADGRRIATAGSDLRVRLWNAVTAEAGAVVLGHSGLVIDMAWSPDGARIAAVTTLGEILIWRVDRRIAQGPLRNFSQ